MSTNSVCNHTSDNKIGRPQRKSDLFITSMITDRIGLHSVLLPLLIIVIIDIIIIVIVIVLNLYQKCLRYTLHSNPCCQLSIHHVFCSLSYLVSSHFRLIVTRRKAMYSHETILSVYKNYTNPVQREWFVLWAILYHHFSICWSLRGESVHSRDIFIM